MVTSNVNVLDRLGEGFRYFLYDHSYEQSLADQFTECKTALEGMMDSQHLTQTVKNNILDKFPKIEKTLARCIDLITSGTPTSNFSYSKVFSYISPMIADALLSGYTQLFSKLIPRIVQTTRVMIDVEKPTWDIPMILKICTYLDWTLSLEQETLDDTKLVSSPFFYFLQTCQNESIQILLEKGLSDRFFYLSKKSLSSNLTVIKCAFEYPLRDEVRIMLLDKWIQEMPQNKNVEGMELLTLSLQGGCDESVIKKFFDMGIYIHENEEIKKRILQLAEAHRVSDEVHRLLFEKLSDSSQNEEMDKKILSYVFEENYEALQKMVPQDHNLLLSNNLPLLIYLMMHENSEGKILKMLDYLNLEINCEDPLYRNSLLQTALENQGYNIIKRILEKTGDIHHISSDGMSAESMGLSHRSLEVIQLFVEKGANIHLPDHRGITPMQNAIVMDRKDIIEYFLTKGAELGWKDLFYAPSLSLILDLLLKKIRPFYDNVMLFLMYLLEGIKLFAEKIRSQFSP